MGKVLVTGATGLIGSQIVAQLRERGDEVVALVRPTTDASALEALGVAIARGDVNDRASVEAAVSGCTGVIHSAAIVGVPEQEITSSRAVNVVGTNTVVDAARAAGVERTVAISTAAVFDRTTTLTERSGINREPTSDPYTSTKIESYHEVTKRIADGQDIVFALPGATYGRSPMGPRMIAIPGANQRLARALRGEPMSYPPMMAPWSHTVHVADVAIAALERGERGRTYIAFGPPDCVTTIAGFVNRACAIAGISYRVDDVSLEQLDDPEVAARFGLTLVEVAKRRPPTPMFDATETHRQLGVIPQPVDAAIIDTLAWLRPLVA